jgi:hypothetical protein
MVLLLSFYIFYADPPAHLSAISVKLTLNSDVSALLLSKAEITEVEFQPVRPSSLLGTVLFNLT